MIEIDSLNKSLGDQPILRDVNLTIPDGEIFAIIGRSGSGKTLLLKHLTGLLVADSGRVLVDGVDLAETGREQRRRIRQQFGVLFQNGAMFDFLSVFENTAFPLRMLTDKPEDEIEHHVMRSLELVEVAEKSARMPAQLSGGELKRVALARAIVMEPAYLFYDEPTTGLDPETSNMIERLIARLRDTLPVTSVLVTHDMHSVFSIVQRVGFLNRGTMQFVGSVDEMRRCPDPELCDFMKANEYQVEER